MTDETSNNQHEDPSQRTVDTTVDLLKEIARGEKPAQQTTFEEDRHQQEMDDRESDRKMREGYGTKLLYAMFGQLIISDVVFIIYAHCGVKWKIPSEVISIWLGATFVELLGVILVITKSLFPNKDHIN